MPTERSHRRRLTEPSQLPQRVDRTPSPFSNQEKLRHRIAHQPNVPAASGAKAEINPGPFGCRAQVLRETTPTYDWFRTPWCYVHTLYYNWSHNQPVKMGRYHYKSRTGREKNFLHTALIKVSDMVPNRCVLTSDVSVSSDRVHYCLLLCPACLLPGRLHIFHYPSTHELGQMTHLANKMRQSYHFEWRLQEDTLFPLAPCALIFS